MILVSQGHEAGIGIEVFIKALFKKPQSEINRYNFFCFQDSLEKTLHSLNLSYELSNTELIIKGKSLSLTTLSAPGKQTTIALEAAISNLKEDDILMTLPSSKDQIEFQKVPCSGHTDYFRKRFNNPLISMNFLSEKLNLMLMTEHIGIDEVLNQLTPDFYYSKVKMTLNNINVFKQFDDVFFAGVNPHCGEDGLISNFDQTLLDIPKKLTHEFPKLRFHPFKPADTLLLGGPVPNAFYIFNYHDQGLVPFKMLNGLKGINLTLGLPFKRVSVDHGTAFELFGKNSADESGMDYLLSSLISL